MLVPLAVRDSGFQSLSVRSSKVLQIAFCRLWKSVKFHHTDATCIFDGYPDLARRSIEDATGGETQQLRRLAPQIEPLHAAPRVTEGRRATALPFRYLKTQTHSNAKITPRQSSSQTGVGTCLNCDNRGMRNCWPCCDTWCNPLRANRVKSADEWRWGSL